MSNIDDFIIEDGILTKYKGTGGHVVIPDGVTAIEGLLFKEIQLTSTQSYGYFTRGAFARCTYLLSVVIPNGVTRIGEAVFDQCERLVKIFLPNSVTDLDEGVFGRCAKLQKVYIPDGSTGIQEKLLPALKKITDTPADEIIEFYQPIDGHAYTKDGKTLLRYMPKAEADCFEIPDGVTRIEEGAFYGCQNLTAVTLPDSITSIGCYAFCDCKNLTDIIIPNGVTSIETGTFSRCRSLTRVTLPNRVTNIDNGAFFHCNSLIELILPASVERVGVQPFDGCSSLKAIHFLGEKYIKMEKCVFWGLQSPLEITFGGTEDMWKKSTSAYYEPPPYEYMYGERCVGRYWSPMAHKLESDFICNVFCKQDGKTFVCKGTEESW